MSMTPRNDKKMNQQQTLLSIVKTWDIQPKPEYRGFRCANCQKYMHKAWYYWLTSGGFIGPVHFCQDCKQKFDAGKIQNTKPQFNFMASHAREYQRSVQNELDDAIKKWDLNAEPIYKIFTCDKCNRNMTKAWHIWTRDKKNLIEVHFCKECGEAVGL
jgi:RNase P subunit RPR2